METKMTIFENKEFGRIRTMNDEKGEPLFCAKDVAEALGYKNTRDSIVKHIEKEDKSYLHQRIRSLRLNPFFQTRFGQKIQTMGNFTFIVGTGRPSCKYA